MKAWLGRLPSAVIERRLAAQGDRSARTALVNYVNHRPNWFDQVSHHLLTSTAAGFDIWCDRHDVIGQTIIATGLWEPLLSRTIAACLRPGDLAIDVGANMGYDTMIMSTAVGPQGTVLAFEPDHINIGLLLKNLTLLAHRNVALHSCGLSDSTAVLKIAVADPGNRGQSHLRPGNPPTQTTQPLLTTRLDLVLSDSEPTPIRLIKLDIEGYEHRALLGAGQLLSRTDFVTCEVDPGYLKQCGTTHQALFETMYSAGFRSLGAQPNSDGFWRECGPDFKIESVVSHHFDVLFYRELTDALLPLVEGPVG